VHLTQGLIDFDFKITHQCKRLPWTK
jgi:hypothetical protein